MQQEEEAKAQQQAASASKNSHHVNKWKQDTVTLMEKSDDSDKTTWQKVDSSTDTTSDIKLEWKYVSLWFLNCLYLMLTCDKFSYRALIILKGKVMIIRVKKNLIFRYNIKKLGKNKINKN